MATSAEVLQMLIRNATEKGLGVSEASIPEKVLQQQGPVLQTVFQGVTAYCKGTDQITMISMQYIQLGAYAGMLASLWQRREPKALAQDDFPERLMAGQRAEELATFCWEQMGIPTGSETADRMDDMIRNLYIKALLEACDGGKTPMDQPHVDEAAGGMYQYGYLLGEMLAAEADRT